MARNPRSKSRKSDWNRLGAQAAGAGDLHRAREFFSRAAHNEKRDASPHLNLAIVQEQMGEADLAAQALTRALRISPGHARAGRRLAKLTDRYVIENAGLLDPVGLRNALRQEGLDRQPLGVLAFACLKGGDAFAGAFGLMEANGAEQAASALLSPTLAPALRNPLFLTALETGVNTDPEWERLLTALRQAVLLDIDDSQFANRELWTFARALLRQCINNEYVFARSARETATLEALSIERGALLAGDPGAGRTLLKLSLYQPLEACIGDSLSPTEQTAIKPHILRDVVVAYMGEREREREFAAEVASPRPLGDETSRRVASQYESSPYPRWRSFAVPESGAARRLLEQFAPVPELAFLDADFDVLIAGAGTGQHALRSAIAYGQRARVLAIDLSKASLGYAARMAQAYGVDNVEFLQADILDLDELPRGFDIIECAGVLHHMAEPFRGGGILAGKLKPGGMMFIGLYSAVSRKNLKALRDDPEYPGPGCDDAAARAFRHTLMTRRGGEAGRELTASADFYTLSDFRDLVLHESELQLTLPEIEAFLARNGLEFRGFMLPPEKLAAFAEAFPGDPLPGSLANWWRFEQDNPSLFDAMYQFWCRKTP